MFHGHPMCQGNSSLEQLLLILRMLGLPDPREFRMEDYPRFGDYRSNIASYSIPPTDAGLQQCMARASPAALDLARQLLKYNPGEYYRLHERHHLVLRSSLGSWLRAGEEEVRMREGELWWFDNRAVHEAFNDGDEDRIHLIFDLLPRARLALAQNQLRGARRREEAATVTLGAAWDAAQRGAEAARSRAG